MTGINVRPDSHLLEQYSVVDDSNSIVQIPGVGKVETYPQSDFPTIEELHFSLDREILTKISAVRTAIGELIELADPQSETEVFISAEAALKTLSQQDLRLLESQGITGTWFSSDNPLGSYAVDRLPVAKSNNSFFQGEPQKPAENIDVLRLSKDFMLPQSVTNPPKNVFGISTQAPADKTADEIANAGFENFPTSAKVSAVCSKDQNGVWQWNNSKVYPDGGQMIDALTASDQYGSSGFEGSVAMVDSNGKISGFRVVENAKRLQQTCIAIGMPPMPVEQYIASVEAAIAANKDFLPPAGTNAKLYIRPFVKALDGGYGVGQAKAYLFSIEVFPFGEYIAKRDDIIDIVQVPGAQRSHEGGTGAKKTSGNYAQSITHKKMAKEGDLPGHEGTKFNDIFYMGVKTEETTDATGAPVTIQRPVLDEAGSSNLFFLTEENGQITLHTPDLNRQSILPGITRDSVLKIAAHFGYQVNEGDFNEKDIQNFSEKGCTAGVSGSAAGAVRVGSMTFAGQKIKFDPSSEGPDASATTTAFFRIYDALYALRQGNAAGFENGTFADTEMADWATEIQLPIVNEQLLSMAQPLNQPGNVLQSIAQRFQRFLKSFAQ